MENASKALIIAGAILISILIISFGVIILGQGSDVINNANMSEAEIAAFNKKFETYEGTNVRGSTLKQLAKTVATHNRSQSSDDKKVTLIKTNKGKDVTEFSAPRTGIDDTSSLWIVKSNGENGTSYDSISVGNFYNIKCFYASTGLVKQIMVYYYD
jgi:hypothetical protein